MKVKRELLKAGVNRRMEGVMNLEIANINTNQERLNFNSINGDEFEFSPERFDDKCDDVGE